MMKKIPLLAAGLLMTLGASAQSKVKGYVYEDTNGNGKKDRREKVLSDVAVSNGVQVVLTDKKGRYELPVSSDNAIFVIKPSGYDVPVNEYNIPQHYYLHKPEGSPKLHYPGVEPTGKLPRSVDFGLVASEVGDNFKALVFGDPQMRNEEELEYFNKSIIDEVEGINDVEFGISLGDLMFNNLQYYEGYLKAIDRIGVPWYNVMGNHDMNFDAKEDSLSDETFERNFGPSSYAYNHGKVHFIILDDIIYPNPGKGGRYKGGLRADQLTFIANDLKYVPKDRLVVMAFHIPLFQIPEEDRLKLFDLLEEYPNTLTLSAHTHIQTQEFYTKEEGWKQDKPHHHYNVGTTCGSWYAGPLNEKGTPEATMRDGTPQGYVFINFKGNQYTIDYKAVNEPADYSMSIYAPKVVAQGEKTTAGIYANFFMGSEENDVVFRVDDGEWHKMHYTEDIDPSYLHLLHEWDFSEKLIPGRRLSNPVPSTHLWRAGIPTDLEEGEHTIEVKATDWSGRSFTGKKTYRVEKPKK